VREHRTIREDEALRLIRNTSKHAHALMVSTMMEKIAERLSENSKEWKLVGLLHDLDCDEVGRDTNQHGIVAAERLKENLPAHCLYAIKAHNHRTGFSSKSRLDKALVATDSLAILTENVTKKTGKATSKQLRAELQNTSASEPWHKNNLMKCEEIGLSLDQLLELCLSPNKKKHTMRKQAPPPKA
jgi:predicted hydrolase (HD superfamily)